MDGRSGPRIVAIVGSLREESKTRIAAKESLDAASEAGASTELIDLRAYDLPPLYATDETVPDAERLKESIAAANGVLLATPNYHGSYSGVLKNALDYCGRDEFEGATVGLLEVAGGRFPGPALIHLRQVARTLNAWTLPTEVAVPRSRSTITMDGVQDDDVAERLRTLGRELAARGEEQASDTAATAD